MNDFIPMQRWFNSAELELGLGIILEQDFRTVTVLFPAVEETRTYSRQAAPLVRAIFSDGSLVETRSRRHFLIRSRQEQNGLIDYHGCYTDGSEPDTLRETEIDSRQQPSRPADRLFSGQTDSNAQFALRYQALQLQARIEADETRGLFGGRTLLLTHQLYIADEVAGRHWPRVLLADEVGLGKTIEAGMIMHHQRLSGRAARILVIVPENLQIQWLVEMLRRFNLHFTLMDKELAEQASSQNNPFDSSQLFICSLSLLAENPAIAAQAMNTRWDLAVVDEAHHLDWHPDHASPEYLIVEQLAVKSRGLLLLTATPEQSGASSHFACLRLLDQQRFFSLDAFEEEIQKFSQYARIADHLLQLQPLETEDRELIHLIAADTGDISLLQTYENSTAPQAARELAAENLLDHLIDRHGTGRILYRNTRQNIAGFPDRELHPYPLQGATPLSDSRSLHPETGFRQQARSPAEWPAIDPRVRWLEGFLREHDTDKCLLITSSQECAVELAAWLRKKSNIPVSAFHEAMSLLERDRAAAYFADREQGARLLVCSEIGSEGRNFQFARHLVLFDLPLNPDLLEQRIGRLDRIGQQHTIQIHVPYLQQTAQENLFHWYHSGLDAFSRNCRAAPLVYKQLSEQRDRLLETPVDSSQFVDFLRRTQDLATTINHRLSTGRDRLLEYNSSHPKKIRKLLKKMQGRENPLAVQQFIEQFADTAGLEMESYRGNSFILRADPQQARETLPELGEDGLAITFCRETALANEDLQFLTWEHPLVLELLDRANRSERGNSAACTIHAPDIKPGQLLTECLYHLKPVARNQLQASRYLPTHGFRILVSASGEDYTARLTHQAINRDSKSLPSEVAKKMIDQFREPIRQAIQEASGQAHTWQQQPLKEARIRAESLLKQEITRLAALSAVNPGIRPAEISCLQQEQQQLDEIFLSAQVTLDGVRLIITT